METKEDKRDPRPADIPGLINRDGKPIIELLDEAFAPVQQTEPARRRTIGELYSQKKATDEIGQLRSLSLQFGIPLMPELPTDHMSVEFTRKIPIQYLKKQKIVPLETPDAFLIAVNDPSNFQAVDDLMRLVGRHDAELVLASEGAILSAIGFAYDLGRDSAQEFTEIMNGESADSIISEIEETADLLDEASDAPIIKLVNLVLAQAIKDRASDIHIEPYANSLKIRYRIDGMLYNLLNLPRRIQSSLVSRIKIMAKLNIAEKRLPQDGRIEVRIGDKSVDIRVSVIPTAFGERVVLRLLDKSQALLTLSDLGLDDTKSQAVRPADQVALRDRPRHGADGQRQDDNALRGSLQDQQPGDQHHHHRGSDRVPDRGDRADPGQSQDRPDLRHRPALHPAPGPGRHPRGRDPRPRDGGDRHPGLADRPPRLLDAAHQRCGQRHHAPDRHGHRALPRFLVGHCHRGPATGARPVPALQGGLRARHGIADRRGDPPQRHQRQADLPAKGMQCLHEHGLPRHERASSRS